MSEHNILNLISLAKTNIGKEETLPGVNLHVQALREPQKLTLEQPLWILCLEGELIVDLPYGDFRILKLGDSMTLAAGLNIQFTPLNESSDEDEVIILRTSIETKSV